MTAASNAGVVLNTTTGAVTTTAAVPAGTYTIDYQFCVFNQFTSTDTGNVLSPTATDGAACASSTATVTVTGSPAVTSVPTLGEWGLIALTSLLATLGLARMRRRPY
ncbi:IPTL-CTERM sorting domain-containing protein [Ottowia sp. VDI28]|uniref:IPTL-CTERM sorting domain-containing protein n=1 Tax=Ottowia sp. VDI28 TaxID=3133968 RepID=UPI003C2E02EA